MHNAEKLNMCHNEYTLSITNANIHIDHHRNSLLPFCLDTLQQRMELQITEWCVCVCVYVCMYVCMYMCVYVCRYVYNYYACMYACTDVRMCVCMYVFIHTYDCVSMYICVCVYVCTYVYMYVCMYVCGLGYSSKLQITIVIAQYNSVNPSISAQYNQSKPLNFSVKQSVYLLLSLLLNKPSVYPQYTLSMLSVYSQYTRQWLLCDSCRKEAMYNYAVAMDLTKVYEEQFQQLYASLRQVEQEQEYVEFIRENKK